MSLALFAAHYSYWVATNVVFPRDLGHLWFAAREVLAGRNPYSAIGPGLAYEWPWPLYYPLPGVLAVLPLAVLPQSFAIAAFSALSIGAFAWAMGEFGYPSMLAVFSFVLWHALHLVQWSPLLAASVVLAPLAAFQVAKPTIGFALFAAKPRLWVFALGVLLIVAAFVIQPSWISDWLAALNSDRVLPRYRAGHFAIVQFPGGVLVLAALARWRRWEARLLAILACVPQTLLPYEAVLLFLIPRGWTESGSMVSLSYVLFMAIQHGPAGFVARTMTLGPAVTWTMYLPATLMVLSRPNRGEVAAWVERLVHHLPAWLRGQRGAETSPGS
jgi:hypothetical protein